MSETTQTGGGVYRCPTPQEAGLTELGDGSLWELSSGYTSATRGFFVAKPHADVWRGPSDDGNPTNEPVFTTRDDALLAWCLATGRRHLCVVPSGQATTPALVARMEAEIRPLIREGGGYDCCGCSTYADILNHAIRIVQGETTRPDDPQETS